MKHSLNLTLSVLLALALALPAAFAIDVPTGDFVQLVEFCEGCHGKDGNSQTPDVPIIAGYSYEGFFNTMDVFRLGDRIAIEFHRPGEPETVMNEIAKQLSAQLVRDLADYYSRRPFVAPRQDVNAELARRGEIIHNRLCEKCHNKKGAHPVNDAAILAGQWTPYLRRQFDNFLSGKRFVPRTMLRRIKELPKEDIEALLSFYASVGMQQ